jgi:hypothetical protein
MFEYTILMQKTKKGKYHKTTTLVARFSENHGRNMILPENRNFQGKLF